MYCINLTTSADMYFNNSRNSWWTMSSAYSTYMNGLSKTCVWDLTECLLSMHPFIIAPNKFFPKQEFKKVAALLQGTRGPKLPSLKSILSFTQWVKLNITKTARQYFEQNIKLKSQPLDIWYSQWLPTVCWSKELVWHGSPYHPRRYNTPIKVSSIDSSQKSLCSPLGR